MNSKISKSKSDNELIMLIRDGNKELIDILINRYMDMIWVKAKSMYILGAEQEDLIQEGRIGLYNAVNDYDFGRDASFSTFAQLCVSRQMYNAVQAANRQKHIPLNNYISLYSSGNDNSDDGEKKKDLIENVPSKKDINPEDMLIDQENVKLLEQKIEEVLSPLEKQVLELAMTGMGYIEIAKVLGKEDKSIDNALQRARTKVKKVISKKSIK